MRRRRRIDEGRAPVRVAPVILCEQRGRDLIFLRLIAFGEHSTDIDPSKMAGSDGSLFSAIWKKLIDHQPLRCSATGTKYPIAAKPSLCVLDVSFVLLLEASSVVAKVSSCI
jgi:hypothetical protein